MKFAIDFEVLRGVRSDGRAMCATQPRGKPLHVALLLDEAKFKETGYALHHHQTVFLDDKTHDWDWRNGKFYYYSHAVGLDDQVDIVVIYEDGESSVLAPAATAFEP